MNSNPIFFTYIDQDHQKIGRERAIENPTHKLHHFGNPLGQNIWSNPNVQTLLTTPSLVSNGREHFYLKSIGNLGMKLITS
jgi:hypothetical protein